jgi:hypothetical protein
MNRQMAAGAKAQAGQDSFLSALRYDLTVGSEVLASWIGHLQAKEGIESLFELEAWLRGLCAFSEVNHLPLSDKERASLITRNFAAEIRIFRLALQECERCAIQLCNLGQDANLGSFGQVETQIYKMGVRNLQINKMLEQYTPTESLAELLEAIQDLKVMADALSDSAQQDFRTFVSLGRMLQRDVRNCRYTAMLLGQRFRIQFDRRDNAALRAVLRSIPEEHLRRNVSMALLYFYRNLKYLKLISAALREDRPLRRFLVIFALLHEQTNILSDFIKSRFLKERQGGSRLYTAVELILHSLKLETQRTFKRELLSLSTERDAAAIYAKIENSHGLLLNCYQNSVVTMVQALDKSVDEKALFPEMIEGAQHGQALRKDLWDLRNDLKSELDKAEGLDLSRVLDRIAQFRESSLRYLMYQDWGEFESLSEFLIMTGNEVEARVLLRKFVSFLEVLMQEVSKRSVLRESGTESKTPGDFVEG